VKTLTRRALVGRGALVSIAVLPACSRMPECVDPARLSRGEEQMRKTRRYVEFSTVAGQRCDSCMFLLREESGACGDCEIFGGPVNVQGHCASWAERG
jgi:hypothetical protein